MKIDTERCLVCGACYTACEHNAIRAIIPDGLSIAAERYEIDEVECCECGDCQSLCPGCAITEGA